MTRTWMISVFAIALVLASGCDSPLVAPAVDAFIPDAAVVLDAATRDAARAACAEDLDCANGVFCDGVERCDPEAAAADSRGCVAASALRCMPTQECVEAMDTCTTRCEVDADADDDGHDAAECGGDDCDDSDALRAPGLAEVCDASGRDEDCDATTFGAQDLDDDGFQDAACCNVAPGGAMLCGSDCDDATATRHPGAAEVCDGADDDCDGSVDEDGAFSCALLDAAADCVSGACVVSSCDPGRGDCNAVDADGCEADLSTSAMHCGGCGMSCGASACVGGRCAGMGDDDAVIDLAAGRSFSCALLASGRVRCWGRNNFGQLGDGTFDDSLTPTYVVAVYDAVELVAAGSTACVRRSGGGVRCWGAPHTRGDGTDALASVPVDLPGVAGATSVGVGGADTGAHGCARSGAMVQCWGANVADGGGTGWASVPSPAPVTAMPARVLAPGLRHTCVLTEGGGVECWGEGRDGQCGVPYGSTLITPRVLTDVPTAVSLASGLAHSCALHASGAVTCWGSNSSGAIGAGVMGGIPLAPTPVVGLANASQLALGYSGSCALRTTGHVVCWGDGPTLGDGTMASFRNAPGAEVDGLTDAVRVAVGDYHACALRATGAVVCWGMSIGAGSTGSMYRTRPGPITGF